MLHLLDRLADTPAMVLDAKFDILAWNTLAAALYSDFSALPPRERNLVRWHFQYASTLMERGDADRHARELVADLRAAAGRHPDDPGINELVTALSAESEQFAELWSAREIKVQRSSINRVVHPVVGPLELDSQALMVSCADQRLLFYTAASGTPSHDALELLRVVGVQNVQNLEAGFARAPNSAKSR